MEESASKVDLISTLLEVCRALKVRDFTHIIPALKDGRKGAPCLEELALGSLEMLQEFNLAGIGAAEELQMPSDPREVLKQLRHLFVELLQWRSADASARVESQRQRLEKKDLLSGETADRKAWRMLAAELRLPEGTTPNDCIRRVVQLHVGDAVLEGLTAQLQCKSARELPQRAGALLRLCDERLASHRIVEALQKLLRVERIAEVLPALKDVLDVGALRRRTVCEGRLGCSNSELGES